MDEATVLLCCSSCSLRLDPPSPTWQAAEEEATAEAAAAEAEAEAEAEEEATTAAAAEAAMAVCLGAVFCLEAPARSHRQLLHNHQTLATQAHLGHWCPRHRSRRCKRWSQPA